MYNKNEADKNGAEGCTALCSGFNVWRFENEGYF
jgi:hypothetical protein